MKGVFVAIITILVIVGSLGFINPKHRIPICPTGTAYVPSDEMCIPGAVNPTRWEWQ